VGLSGGVFRPPDIDWGNVFGTAVVIGLATLMLFTVLAHTLSDDEGEAVARAVSYLASSARRRAR